MNTFSFYPKYLPNSFSVIKAERLNIKSKNISNLQSNSISDLSLRNAKLNPREQEETHIMEISSITSS